MSASKNRSADLGIPLSHFMRPLVDRLHRANWLTLSGSSSIAIKQSTMRSILEQEAHQQVSCRHPCRVSARPQPKVTHILRDSDWPHRTECQGDAIRPILRQRNCCDFREEAELCTATAPKAKSATDINVLYTKTTQQPKETICQEGKQ